MIQGISLAGQAMTALMQKQDQIANNLANMNTTGYKQSGLFVSAFQRYVSNDKLEPSANREVKADEVFIDFREGAPRKTGTDLDVAIKGSGFFTVMTQNGLRYTRNGNFSLNHDGFLVTSDGHKVMGLEGFIRLDGEEPVRILENGEVLQGNETRETLRIADFRKPYRMLRDGSSMFRPQLPKNPPVNSPGYLIKQGFLEASNVSPVRNMAQMIASFRNYEADQKALLAQDQTLDKAVNQIGRVG